ncbi:MAG: iron-containing alcohol dehydrogenase [Bacteroidales bacterium]|nr:iron-containing alcohol dehydrogenase [Bacteroidales bacterium]
MVNPFQFTRLPLIFFGNGKISALPGMIKKYGTTIILVTGRSSFLNSDAAGSLLSEFKENGIKYQSAIIRGEPSPDVIDDIVSRFGGEHVDVVVAIGGGSALDSGKAISAMMYKDGSLQDYLEGVGTKEHPGTKITFIAVPTTSGTGSEATKNAVISRIGKDGFKRSLRHDNLVPDIALVDPGLTLSCTPETTAASGMDCFTQLTEAYLSVKSCEYTDALAYEGLKAIKSSLVRAYLNGQDIEARAGMSFAALTSGICLANAGLGIVHGFAASIGGMYNIPHGIVCGTLMASSNEVTVARLRQKRNNDKALEKYTLLGRLFLDEKNRSDDYYIDGFIDYLNRLTSELKLPGLKESGIMESDIREISLITEGKNNPVDLSPEDLTEILYKRFV